MIAELLSAGAGFGKHRIAFGALNLVALIDEPELAHVTA